MTEVRRPGVEHLASLVDQLRKENAQLEEALASRVVIEQAKGILAERFGTDVGAAFEVLRRAARSNRVRLRDLAAEVVRSPRTPTAIELAFVGGNGAATRKRRPASASRTRR